MSNHVPVGVFQKPVCTQNPCPYIHDPAHKDSFWHACRHNLSCTMMVDPVHVARFYHAAPAPTTAPAYAIPVCSRPDDCPHVWEEAHRSQFVHNCRHRANCTNISPLHQQRFNHAAPLFTAARMRPATAPTITRVIPSKPFCSILFCYMCYDCIVVTYQHY